ncbi:hypothetical protein [Nannocystis pusilla]|uniref:hypothetical protein n=1 Tax=Nannocystis pusilla TaxID=889268 RepID=UPI003B7D53B3
MTEVERWLTRRQNVKRLRFLKSKRSEPIFSRMHFICGGDQIMTNLKLSVALHFLVLGIFGCDVDGHFDAESAEEAPVEADEVLALNELDLSGPADAKNLQRHSTDGRRFRRNGGDRRSSS